MKALDRGICHAKLFGYLYCKQWKQTYTTMYTDLKKHHRGINESRLNIKLPHERERVVPDHICYLHPHHGNGVGGANSSPSPPPPRCTASIS